MEEYLPVITNDMMVCLIKAGSVFIRSEIWKFFLIARDGYTHEVIKKSPKRSKGNKKDDVAFRDEPLQSLCKNRIVAFLQIPKASSQTRKRKRLQP